MKPETLAALEALIAYLDEEIKILEQSRRLYLAPAERHERIRQRKRWITAIQELATEIEARQ